MQPSNSADVKVGQRWHRFAEALFEIVGIHQDLVVFKVLKSGDGFSIHTPETRRMGIVLDHGTFGWYLLEGQEKPNE